MDALPTDAPPTTLSRHLLAAFSWWPFLDMRILLADDTLDTINLYRLSFTKAGHTVYRADDGTQALSLARSMSFDVIILDGKMPGVSGWEAAASIRQWPHCQAIPIIVFTAYESVGQENPVAEVDVDRVLLKPMMPNDLLKIMVELVAERNP